MNQRVLSLGSATALFISGFAALIYQSTWAQYLGLVLGHSAYAQSLVLMLFMGGMAAGAALTGRYITRIQRPVLWYVGAEIFLALAGLSYHLLFVSGRETVFEQLLPWLDAAWASSGVIWIFAASTILLQTLALGATFPLIAQVLLTQTRGGRGRIISILYFANSIGAALAALANVSLIMPAAGLSGSVMIAGLLNALAAVIVWSSFGGYSNIQKASARPAESSHPSTAPKSTIRTIYMAAAITGAASFVYEIVWVRILVNALGSSMHVFELMLSAFILGIALGGYVIRNRIDHIKDLTRAAGYVQLAMGTMALLSCFGFAGLFHSIGHFMDAMAPTDPGYWWFSILTSALGFLVMLPATICAGMILPLLTTSLYNQGGGDKTIGQTYAANTLGSIAGVLLAVHILMPRLGVENAVLVAGAADFALGIFLIGLFARGRTRSRKTWSISATATTAFVVLAVTPALSPGLLSSGVYRYGDVNPEHGQTAFYRDGATASIAVKYHPGSNETSITTNGKPEASISPLDKAPSWDEPTMILTGLIPFLFTDEPGKGAVIGLGSGLTSHSALASPGIEQLDTIEIEPAMVEGARKFGNRVERVYKDPRSNIIIDDARAYFSSTHNQYDFILSEPSNPWVSGVANLFTPQFYRFTKRHLTSDGILVQWMQLYYISPRLVATVFNALGQEFDDYAVYMSNDTDMIIVASPEGTVGKPSDILTGKNSPFSSLATRAGIDSRADLQARRVGDKKLLSPLFSELSEVANSDYFPILGLQAPKSRYKDDSARAIGSLTRSGLPWFQHFAHPDNTGQFSESLREFSLYSLPKERETARAVQARLLGKDGESSLPYEWSSRVAFVQQCPREGESRAYIDATVEILDWIKGKLGHEQARTLADNTGLLECSFDNEFASMLTELLKLYVHGEWRELLNKAEKIQARGGLAHMPARFIEITVFASLVADQPERGYRLRQQYGAHESLTDTLLQGHLRQQLREKDL